MLPALFFRFLQRWQANTLPYAYQDGIMDAAACRQMLAAADPVAAFCADPMLWGSLAGCAGLVRAARVRCWAGQQLQAA
jgi:D-arabinitol 4-dehydrogenase